MVKQIQKLKCVIAKLFEEELLALVALLVIALEIFFVQAQTSDQTNLFFAICPVGGSLTVLDPNGGERWKVNDTVTITWSTCNADNVITNVKIELQRTSGSWETLSASTVNDGSFSWQVTEPTTFTALVRISNVDNAATNDVSDAVFEIYKTGGGQPPPPTCQNVVIDRVTPWRFSNTEDVILKIEGYFAYGDEEVYLNDELLESTYVSENEIDAIVPAGFPAGIYTLKVINYCGNYAEYVRKIDIYEEPCLDPVIDSVEPTNFSNALDVVLTIKGQFQYGDEEVFLDEEPLGYSMISETEIEAYVSAGFPPGTYTLVITNGCGGRAEYGTKIVIYEEEEEEEEIEEPLEPIIDIIQPIFDLFKPSVRPPSTGGKKPWTFTPDSRFYTDKFEQNWICYLIWFIILLIFALLLKDYFTEDNPKNKKQTLQPRR